MTRQCGECTLCCKLLPVPPLNKLAGQKCKHQRFRTGCAVYHAPGFPIECGVWSCRWLINDDADDLPRPDRSHYVIDIMPDFVTAFNDQSGVRFHIQVLQIWIDPKFPDAHKAPELRRYIERRGRDGIAAIIRSNNRDAFTLFPPNMTPDGQWREVHSDVVGKTHTLDEIAAALSE